MAWAPELAAIDARYFQTLLGRESMIGQDHDEAGAPIQPEFMTREAFLAQMEGVYTILVEEGRKRVKRDASKLWIKHPSRRRFWGVRFDPEGGDGRHYNLWKGFAVAPEPGAWCKLREHIRDVICCGDATLFDFVLGWMARAVQAPHLQAETAIVLRGAKGSGKGTFANAFGRLFGPHFLAVSNKLHLVGRFNSHLRACVVLFVDEGFWAGDVQNEGTLKQLITEPFLPIEAKFQDVVQAPNRLHVIMASNDAWVVPVSGMERRYCVLDLSDERAQDIPYFAAIHAQLEAGGYSAMLADLLAYDLSNFEHRKPPHTAGLHAQMLHSLKGFDAWWYTRLCSGNLLRNEGGWKQVALTSLFDDYKHEVRFRPLTQPQFEDNMRHAAPEMQKRHISVAGAKRMDMLGMPPLSKCREEWAHKHGNGETWT